MNAVIVIFIVVIVLFVVVKLSVKGEGTGSETPPYFKKKTLLNEKEQVLFNRLVEALPECFVFAQVRLADIVGIKKTKNWQTWFNKVSRKSVDFVVCNKSFVVLACIELDGKTHEQEDRQKADNDKDAALNAAGIPILRIEVSRMISVEEIKMLFDKKGLH
jgi:very-short-patch-repair endonuclease